MKTIFPCFLFMLCWFLGVMAGAPAYPSFEPERGPRALQVLERTQLRMIRLSVASEFCNQRSQPHETRSEQTIEQGRLGKKQSRDKPGETHVERGGICLLCFLCPSDFCSLTFALLPALSQSPTMGHLLSLHLFCAFASGWELVAFAPDQMVDSDFSAE